MCKGQCPGTAIDGDWRNKSEHCAVWMAVYEHLEQELIDQGKQPLSRSPSRPAIERAMLDRWERGEMAFMARLAQRAGSLPGHDSAAAPGSGGWQRELSELRGEMRRLADLVRSS